MRHRQESGLPFFDVLLIEGLPKGASLPLATTRVCCCMLRGGWKLIDCFDVVAAHQGQVAKWWMGLWLRILHRERPGALTPLFSFSLTFVFHRFWYHESCQCFMRNSSFIHGYFFVSFLFAFGHFSIDLSCWIWMWMCCLRRKDAWFCPTVSCRTPTGRWLTLASTTFFDSMLWLSAVVSVEWLLKCMGRSLRRNLIIGWRRWLHSTINHRCHSPLELFLSLMPTTTELLLAPTKLSRAKDLVVSFRSSGMDWLFAFDFFYCNETLFLIVCLDCGGARD